MSNVVVLLSSTAALLVALAIAIRWGGLESAEVEAVDTAASVRRMMHRLCVLEVSGLIAGLLVGGFGGRLMMRIIALTSPPAAQGRTTDAGEIVGRISAGGTFSLFIFVGLFFGLFGAIVYGLLAGALPRRAWIAAAIFGPLMLGFFARRDPLSPTNSDFQILSPVLLAVAMIVVLFLLFAFTLVALVVRLDRAYPALSGTRRSLLAHLPLLLLALPPMPLALVGAALFGVIDARIPSIRLRMQSPSFRSAALVLIVLVTVASNVWMAAGIRTLLA